MVILTGIPIFLLLPAFSIPTTVETMNYNSVILVGTVAITLIWWVAHATRHYPGPKVMSLYVFEDRGGVHHGVEVSPAADGGEPKEKRG